jgi:hypothetical protein
MFSARTKTTASPERVLEVLTDPAAIRTWSPVPFEVSDLDGARLERGSKAHVSGSLGGLGVGFDVEVQAADTRRLELIASGPIGLDVRYDLAEIEEGSEVKASVTVRRGGGISGRIVAKATEALLAAGALEGAAGRIARAAEAAPALAVS